jgi:hypothetical protein
MRSLLIIAALLIGYLLLNVLFGNSITMFIASAVFFTAAFLITYNDKYFHKYYKMMNPSYYKNYLKKSSEVKKRSKETNIALLHIVAALMFINAFISLRVGEGIAKEGLRRELGIVCIIFLVLAILFYIIDKGLITKSGITMQNVVFIVTIAGLISIALYIAALFIMNRSLV